MTSRELVTRTLEFDGPDRIPRQLWLLPWASEHHPDAVGRIARDFPDDIVTAPAIYATPPKTVGDQYAVGSYTDEWGCVFENRQRGIIGEVKQPILTDWIDVDSVRPPLETLDFDRDTVNGYCRSTDRFVLAACCPRPFERLQFIRSTVNTFYDVMDRPDEFSTLLGRIHSFYMEEFERWASTDVDGLMFMDDWGAQQALLLPPGIWRELFRPLYRDYISLAHDHGKYCFMHSDGYILEIMPDLVEIGLDALNSQLFCMGVETVGERFRGQMTFWGEIDRQHILPHATTTGTAAAVKRVAESLYDNGGVIAQCEFGPGARPGNVATVFETWDTLGK